MDKKFWIAGAAAAVLSLAAGFIGHGMLLHNDYAQIPSLMRTEADAMAHLPFLLVSHLVKGFAFAWVYQRGVSGAPWVGQGVRYGVAMALLVAIPLYLVYYAVQPMPGALVVKQMVVDSIGLLIMSIVVAFICRPPAQSS